MSKKITKKPIKAIAKKSTKKKAKTPAINSLVKFIYDGRPTEYHKAYPFSDKQVFVYLGEISNMLGHGIVAETQTGQVYTCVRIDDFIELTEDEI